MYASTEHVGYDFGNTLPDPIRTDGVSNEGETCESHPELIGTGDCSNTIEGQWKQAAGLAGAAHDVAELRFTADVPPGINGFAFDFAMFSTEYPRYYQQQFNDMFIAWLESERWTGNVSFDEQGNPISLNAGFLDYKDAPNDIDCPQPCEAPELSGTAMEGHAATKWLTTTAPVSPGETIEVVLLVFDLSDGILDIAVMLDNFRWTCDGDAPLTRPAG
jgi:hypothetical protein